MGELQIVRTILARFCGNCFKFQIGIVLVFISFSQRGGGSYRVNMATFDLTEVADNTKQAREATLVGKYDEAIVFYASVIQMISRHVTQNKDQNSKQKWQQVEQVLM